MKERKHYEEESSSIIIIGFSTVGSACGGDTASNSADTGVAFTQQAESVENIETDSSQVNTEENEESVSEENSGSEDNENESTGMTDSDITLDTIEDIIAQDVADKLAVMETEYEAFITEMDTYDKYVANVDGVEAYYAKVCEDNKQLCIKMCEYGILYAELILASDMDNDDKYDACSDMFDCIYEDAYGEIFDNIYDGIYDELFDEIYDGILQDAYDTVPVSEWIDVRSEEYEIWLDSRSDVYEDWLDSRSDIYDFWLDVRSALLSEDIEKAYEEVEDFIEDVEKMKSESTSNREDTGSVESENATAENEEERIESVENEDMTTTTEDAISDMPSEEVAVGADGLRPEFKEAMDSYEAFYDEYCEFMKKYQENPTDLTLLTEYADMLASAAEMDGKFEKWEEEELNEEELKYYLGVQTRVSQKMLEIL